jgi:hypothetical protein
VREVVNWFSELNSATEGLGQLIYVVDYENVCVCVCVGGGWRRGGACKIERDETG